MLYFLFMIVLLGVVVTPIVIFTVARVVPRVVDRTVPPIMDRFASGMTPEVEARLTRIEEAIDAMAVEIERLRTGEVDSSQGAPRLGPSRMSDRESRSLAE